MPPARTRVADLVAYCSHALAEIQGPFVVVRSRDAVIVDSEPA